MVYRDWALTGKTDTEFLSYCWPAVKMAMQKVKSQDDGTSNQTRECWVGTSWGVVAGMIQEGLAQQAGEIGASLVDTIWNTDGLWFRTPEAWEANGNIRAPYYMRATSAWAAKHAYDLSP
jgi:non-lysosomal glucosylceramidase